MSYPAFNNADLLTSEDRLNQLQDACANNGVADGIAEAITSAVGTVNRFTARYRLDVDDWMGFVRKLAMYELLNLARSAGESDGKDYDRVMKQLRDIRDGLHQDLAPADADSTPTPLQSGEYGGKRKLCTW